ncbi:MAG: opacity protein-like surface antigen [Rickettsiales bacterium]|jgi:opacity protein-like surface antigen
MKKLLTIFCSVFLISNSAFADGFFVGADVLRADVRQQARNSNSLFGADNGSGVNGNKMGYGVNAGIRGDLLFLVGSAELFYDNLDISTKSFNSASNTGDAMKIQNRYGAKVNVGTKIFPFVTSFLTLGLANVDYEFTNQSNNNSKSDSQFSPLYGIGILVDLPLKITLKASYDYQQFDDIAPRGAKIRNRLGVAKVGVIYNF